MLSSPDVYFSSRNGADVRTQYCAHTDSLLENDFTTLLNVMNDMFRVLCVTEEDIDEFNIHVSRYRPEELTKLTKITKFNKKEIQLIYRGFKQVSN